MLRTGTAIAAGLCLSWATSVGAQSDPAEPKLDWQIAPLLAEVGDDLAEIELPEGFRYLDQAVALLAGLRRFFSRKQA